MNSEAVLACSGLVKAYGDIRAVDRAKVRLHRGEVLCLLGPSGCGKTTILRIIAGFEQPDAGVVKIKGKTVQDRATSVPPEQRDVGLVFQDFALFPHLNVRRNIGYGLPDDAKGKERGRQVLALVGMEGFGDRMPHELSGGQKQRVALARALAPRPTVVLFDEPFSNLDARLRRRLRREVREILRRENTGAIFVTHDQEEALSMADRVAVMRDGVILCTAPPSEIYGSPSSVQTGRTVGRLNLLPADVREDAIQCAVGQFTCRSLCRTGHEPVWVGVRPEDVELSPHPRGRGRVLGREYLGFAQLVRVQLGPSTIIHALIDSEASVDRDERVRVRARGIAGLYAGDGSRIEDARCRRIS